MLEMLKKRKLSYQKFFIKNVIPPVAVLKILTLDEPKNFAINPFILQTFSEEANSDCRLHITSKFSFLAICQLRYYGFQL